MPKRIITKPLAFIGRHDHAVIMFLSVALVIALVFAVVGWTTAREAERRVISVEAKLTAERLGKSIADVTTCFNTARNRPRLIVILRGIAVEIEPDPRQELERLIEDYEMDTPTTPDCVKLARERNIDPAPYLKNPPAEAAK